MRSLLLILSVTFCGCAWTTVRPVPYGDRTHRGLRVYDPMPLLVVTSQASNIVFVPDFQRAYAVTFSAWLAKNAVTLKTTEGALTELSSNLDTTGLLSLLQGLGEKALDSAEKLKALGSEVSGTIPSKEGVWRFVFKPDGVLEKMERVPGF